MSSPASARERRSIDVALVVASIAAGLAAWLLGASWACATDGGANASDWCFPAAKPLHLVGLAVGSGAWVGGLIAMAIRRGQSLTVSRSLLGLSLLIFIAIAIASQI